MLQQLSSSRLVSVQGFQAVTALEEQSNSTQYTTTSPLLLILAYYLSIFPAINFLPGLQDLLYNHTLCAETAQPWGQDLCLRTFYLGICSFMTLTERVTSQMTLQPAQKFFEMLLFGYLESHR